MKCLKLIGDKLICCEKKIFQNFTTQPKSGQTNKISTFVLSENFFKQIFLKND